MYVITRADVCVMKIRYSFNVVVCIKWELVLVCALVSVHLW